MEKLTISALESALESNSVVFIDFFANWCGPCKMMMPIVEQLADEYKDKVAFYKVDVDEEEELASRFGVQSIPTFFVIKDGKVANKVIGSTKKSVLEEMIK